MPNERLRNALASAGLTAGTLAERLAVDPKTVERWVAQGRTPHRRHRASTSSLLGLDELYLWPAAYDVARSREMGEAELVSLFPNRAAVPRELCLLLQRSASEAIDILVYAGLFLAETHEIIDGLSSKAREGVRVRLLVGDPDCAAVAVRGREEGIGEDLAARIRISLRYLQPLIDDAAIDVRLHTTTLYASLLRYDDDLLVTAHTYGAAGAQCPVMHFRRLGRGKIYAHYMRSFEAVWDTAIEAQRWSSDCLATA
jgi:transcriptional regulator with XRE-family HTH domain